MLHISAGVNRAWGTSMEIGVRVMRESAEAPTEESYCCHGELRTSTESTTGAKLISCLACAAYLTFVTKPLPPSPSRLNAILSALNLRPPAGKTKVQVAPIEPQSTLESKRFLLAGRRRAHRIKASKGTDDLLVRMRKQVTEMVLAQEHESEGEREEGIEKLQEEM